MCWARGTWRRFIRYAGEGMRMRKRAGKGFGVHVAIMSSCISF